MSVFRARPPRPRHPRGAGTRSGLPPSPASVRPARPSRRGFAPGTGEMEGNQIKKKLRKEKNGPPTQSRQALPGRSAAFQASLGIIQRPRVRRTGELSRAVRGSSPPVTFFIPGPRSQPSQAALSLCPLQPPLPPLRAPYLPAEE